MATKVEIRLPDGVTDAYIARPEPDGPWPAVLFFQDGLGWRHCTRLLEMQTFT